MTQIKIIPAKEFDLVRHHQGIDKYEKLAIIADMCRLNTLAAVKKAGSGHLGSSFSAMDIVVWLYYAGMNTAQLGFEHPDRDIYFSSKGHDVPGLYATFFSLGLLEESKLLRLRRLNGLPGHPDIETPGIEANSGSLGMGISKGRGIAWAKQSLGLGGRVYVMTGDGELQEGQNFEALQAAAHQRVDRLTVIVDRNRVQSDKLVCEILDLGDLQDKIKSFGWNVTSINGHDFKQIEAAVSAAQQVKGAPQMIIAETIKGRGVSFMEHPTALRAGDGFYPWHSGAPEDHVYEAAHEELVTKINMRLEALGANSLSLKSLALDGSKQIASTLVGEPVSAAAQTKPSTATNEYVSTAFGQALVEAGATNSKLIVLDADLASDCKVREFEHAYPERFIENGIAEQDMVSMAGGLARQGLLPVVNSFASFLASRANEQIYNNASEKTKIIYGLHYAGVIPAGPGKSHQSIRDISLFGAIPNCTILQPCNSEETKLVVKYCVEESEENCAIRIVIGPSPRRIELPMGYKLTVGRGVSLLPGTDAAILAYGPVMLHEALLANEVLSSKGFGLKVINMPWLNRLDTNWFEEITRNITQLYVLEDHSPVGGLGDFLLRTVQNTALVKEKKIRIFAIDSYPAFGTPKEVLKFHGLDGTSLAERILLDCDAFSI